MAAFLAARAAAIFCANFESGFEGESIAVGSEAGVLDDAEDGTDGAGDDLAEAAARLCSASKASFDFGFAASDGVSGWGWEFDAEVAADEEA